MTADEGHDALDDVIAERDRLQRWKDEALPVIFGLQDLGRALEIRLGRTITGPDALEAVNRLRTEGAADARAVAAVRRLIADARRSAGGPMTAQVDCLTLERALVAARAGSGV